MCWPRRARCARRSRQIAAALRHSGRREGQHRRQGSADDGRVPGLSSTTRKRTRLRVARLREAGALILGKTNLDQFATGLVGVRTPYGIGRNLFNRKLVPGGSSTGSALAVAAGLVPLALGTDTAGSGRVPAGFNNIVGLKPSRAPDFDRRRRACLPHARLRFGLWRSLSTTRSRCSRSSPVPMRPTAIFAQPRTLKRRRPDAAGSAARRAAQRPAPVLRRPYFGRGL